MLEIKKEIERALGIAVTSQKLLLLGHSLNDEKPVSAYPLLKDGAKINLIVKREEGLRELMCRQFRKYYDEKLSEHLSREVVKDLDRKLASFSLDDLERLAETILCN